MALTVFSEVLKIDNKYEPAQMGIALIQNKKENYQEVITICETVLEINPENERALYFLENARNKLD